MTQTNTPLQRYMNEAVAPECSVVVPVCNEKDNLPWFHQRLTAVLRGLAIPYEVIYVDGGSTDETPALIEKLHEGSSLVKGLFLSGNFGRQAALSAGLEAASGRAVISMDGDLRDPPELIPQLIARWREGAEIVRARPGMLRGNVLERAACYAFHRVLRGKSELPIPLDTGDYALIDEQVLAVLNGLPERNRVIRGLRSWVGYTQAEVAYDRETRHAGRPKHPLRCLFGLTLGEFVGASGAPLKAIRAIGWMVALLAVVGSVAACTGALPGDRALLIVVAALTLLCGVQLVGLGIIAEYAYRAYAEGCARPPYVVARRVGFGSRVQPPPDLTDLIAQARDAATGRRVSPSRLEQCSCRLAPGDSE